MAEFSFARFSKNATIPTFVEVELLYLGRGTVRELLFFSSQAIWAALGGADAGCMCLAHGPAPPCDACPREASEKEQGQWVPRGLGDSGT